MPRLPARRPDPSYRESREYRIFKEEEKLKTLPRSLYERACRFALRFFTATLDEKTKKRMQENIDFSHLAVKPEGVATLTVLLGIVVSLPLLALMAADFFGYPGVPPNYTFLTLAVFLPFLIYLYQYPSHLRKIYEMETGSEIVNMILYISVYMRNAPNLEGAVEFAAENLSGKLVYELRKLLWDVEVGNYLTMQEGLLAYGAKWKENRPFLEAIDLIIGSLSHGETRRQEMLDQSVDVILAGNREGAKHFTQELNTPVMFIHAMGIILPLLGFVMFPLLAIFLNIGSAVLFVIYDVMLPAILFFSVKHVLERRPATFSKIDVSMSPDVPKSGTFLLDGKEVTALPVAGGVFAVTATLAWFLYGTEGTQSIAAALLAVGSVAMSIATYYYLTTYQALNVRERTRAVEEEFSDTLFRMGNNLSSGVPIEKVLEQSVSTSKNLKIRGLFARALENIHNLGMTFRQAFFDEKYGAVRLYPSRLIRSVMTTVSESAERGSKSASSAMLSMARYLKSLHDTQEDVRAELGDPLSSMKFQVFFMSPMITGIIVTLTMMILRILSSLGQQAKGLPYVPFLDSFYSTGITPFEFVLVVSAYLLETCLLLSMFINGIENGEDREGFRKYSADSIIVGFIFFWIVIAVTLVIFMPIIDYTF